MYAVIRTGGKQYRVAPGDVLKVEKLEQEDGKGLAIPGSARVLASVVSEGRAKKILVFHFKRKKQYKKMQGHRQSYTQIRINEIQIDGKSFTAAG